MFQFSCRFAFFYQLFVFQSGHGEVNRQETRVAAGAILQRRPHDRSLSLFDMIPACDRQTDRRTYRRTESIVANTALCIASYADAL